MLKQFVHAENGQVLGTVVAVKTEDNQFGVGWSISKTNTRVHDAPSKAFGVKIAEGRALSDRRTIEEEIARMPMNLIGDAVAHAYLNMYDRARRYFKDARPLQVSENNEEVSVFEAYY